MILVAGTTKTLRALLPNPHLGRLIVPNGGSPADGKVLWAADNAAFSGFNREQWVRMLERHKNVPNCLFCVAPDVIGKAKETIEMFEIYEPIIRASGLPVAFVAQDGLTVEQTPWDKLDCLFIGGSTEFKLSARVVELAAKAKSLKKWLHVGRVNSMRRLQFSFDIHADSVDGSGYSKFAATLLPNALSFCSYLNQQGKLF